MFEWSPTQGHESRIHSFMIKLRNLLTLTPIPSTESMQYYAEAGHLVTKLRKILFRL